MEHVCNPSLHGFDMISVLNIPCYHEKIFLVFPLYISFLRYILDRSQKKLLEEINK